MGFSIHRSGLNFVVPSRIWTLLFEKLFCPIPHPAHNYASGCKDGFGMPLGYCITWNTWMKLSAAALSVAKSMMLLHGNILCRKGSRLPPACTLCTYVMIKQ